MGKGMCKFKASPLEIKYSNEDKVNFLFCRLLYVNIFCQFFLCITFSSFFSITIMHNLTFSFVVANLPTKLSFSKKLCSSKKQLYYVIVGKILWEWVQEYHLLWHGTFVTSLLTLFALLCLLVFWTNLGVIGC